MTTTDVIETEVSDRPNRSAEEKMTFREQQFAAYFKETSRWRVRPTVFMPTRTSGNARRVMTERAKLR